MISQSRVDVGADAISDGRHNGLASFPDRAGGCIR